MVNNSNTALSLTLSYLPEEVSGSIKKYLSINGTSEGGLSEIRLRAYGPLGLAISGKNVSLPVRISEKEVSETFSRVCRGAVFAHRDDVCSGFVPIGQGVRVGVCGRARYERGILVGVSDISALVFRIPSGECSFAGEIYSEWKRRGGGMLIYSAAGEGKTTAIRSLARLIGSGKRPYRVVVADERSEFDEGAYRSAHVDVLKGYKRSLGIEIAIRTMSAEVLIVDEISSPEDARALLLAIGAGVDVIATAHGRRVSEISKRPHMRELIEAGLFSSFCSLKREGERFSFCFEEVSRKRIERTSLATINFSTFRRIKSCKVLRENNTNQL